MKQYYYIGKEEALKHQSMVYGVSEFRVENYKDKFGNNSIEFYGDNLPYYLTVVGEEVREATNIELYKSGIYELTEGEFINNDSILNIGNFGVPEDMVKPVFDHKTLCYIETATAEEIDEYNFKESVSFYNSELEFASKATAELACNIIDENTFEDVRIYMRAIDPYAQTKILTVPKRPSIFDKYNYN